MGVRRDACLSAGYGARLTIRAPSHSVSGTPRLAAVTRLRLRGEWRYRSGVWSSAWAAETTVIGLRSHWRRWLAAVAALGCAAVVGVAPARAADVDPAQMSADEIKALEQRLTDAGCYQGAIDGQTSGALDAAIKACPDQRPFLRIETGMHTAVITRIGVDAACSLLATASDDKTVRLWSLPDGKLTRVMRLPIGDGNAGKVYATALSPDGRFLAAGGWDAAGQDREPQPHARRPVEWRDPALRRVRECHRPPRVLRRRAAHRDRARRNNGVRVLDTATGAELLADRDYGNAVYGLAFAPDGGLIASSDDGLLRRYGPDLKLTVKRAAPDGKDPLGVAIDPSGRRVAIGYIDKPHVSILDAKTLAPTAKAQTGDLTTDNVASVAWSRDGATLVAGGLAEAQFQGEWRFLLRRFDAAGRRKGKDVAASQDTISDVQPCGDGFAFAGALRRRCRQERRADDASLRRDRDGRRRRHGRARMGGGPRAARPARARHGACRGRRRRTDRGRRGVVCRPGQGRRRRAGGVARAPRRLRRRRAGRRRGRVDRRQNSLGARRVGDLNFALAQKFVAEVALVSDAAILEAQRRALGRPLDRRGAWRRGGFRRARERRLSAGEGRGRRPRLRRERRSGGAGEAR